MALAAFGPEMAFPCSLPHFSLPFGPWRSLDQNRYGKISISTLAPAAPGPGAPFRAPTRRPRPPPLPPHPRDPPSPGIPRLLARWEPASSAGKRGVCAGTRPAPGTPPSLAPVPGSLPLRSITAWLESQTGAATEGEERCWARSRARLSGRTGFRGAPCPPDDARGVLAAGGARRASPRSALDRGYPAGPEMASPAAREPHDRQPGRDHRASVQPCPPLPGSLPRQCPGPPPPERPRDAAAAPQPPTP